MGRRELFLSQVLPNLIVALNNTEKLKEINGYRGLLHGDLIVRLVSVLADCHTGYDGLITCWNGKEFLFRWWNDTPQQGLAHLERLRFSLIGTGLNVTASGGITRVKMNEESLEGISRAQNLMSQAKREGRNRILFGPAV